MDYHFEYEEIKSGAIGRFYENENSIECTMHSNKAPSEGDIIKKENNFYECVLNVDVTDDEEREQGLSYSNIELYKIENNVRKENE